ncbi:MAG: phosphate propanoyltransferase [Deltaproteobacteria bacterium]|nr:phosphate propanoyltransferase [Deltaproteobacteria bacterium]
MEQPFRIPVALSARHVHLSQEHVEALFGAGHRLTPWRDLSQPGQFACTETVEVVGPKGSLRGVRVLGPARDATQAELSITDGFVIGVNLPVRLSGNTVGTPGGFLIGPKGAVQIDEGFICAARHIHLHSKDADVTGLQHGQRVLARAVSGRKVMFEDVIVRVSPDFRTEMHVDLDEGNAAGVRDGDLVDVVEAICGLCANEACPIREDVTVTGQRPYCDFTQSGVQFR